MHWGVRRYQNPDGSLTNAGRKRANSLATKYSKVTGGKDIKDHEKSGVDLGHETNPRKIRKMSDEDLALRTKRIDDEVKYMKLLDTYSQYSAKLNPEKNHTVANKVLGLLKGDNKSYDPNNKGTNELGKIANKAAISIAKSLSEEATKQMTNKALDSMYPERAKARARKKADEELETRRKRAQNEYYYEKAKKDLENLHKTN